MLLTIGSLRGTISVLPAGYKMAEIGRKADKEINTDSTTDRQPTDRPILKVYGVRVKSIFTSSFTYYPSLI